jgi:TPR repeat protein
MTRGGVGRLPSAWRVSALLVSAGCSSAVSHTADPAKSPAPVASTSPTPVASTKAAPPAGQSSSVAHAPPVTPAPVQRPPEPAPVLRSEATADVDGEAIILTIVRGVFFVERVPGSRVYNQGLRDPRPVAGAHVTIDLGGRLSVLRAHQVDVDGSPLGRDREVLHGETDEEGRVKFTLTNLPAIAIPTDGGSFAVNIDGEDRLSTLPGGKGMALWQAIAADPASRMAREIPADIKMLLDRADESISHGVDRDDLSDAEDALNEFAEVDRMVREHAAYAARAEDRTRAAALRVRLAARSAEIEAHERSIANETPEARKRRLKAEQGHEELTIRTTLQAIKQKGRALPAAPCPRGQVLLRPFRSDGAWTVGAKECAESPAAALATYEAACKQGSVSDCYHLGVAYVHGNGGERDVPKARSLFDQACTGGWAAECARGKSPSSACDDGDLEACLPLLLGSNADQTFRGLTALFRLGGGLGPFQGVLEELGRTDPIRSEGLFEVRRFAEISCFRGYAHGCNELGFMFQNALAWRRDLGGAARLYAKACSAGALQACSRLGSLYGVLGDFDYDAKIQNATCEAGAGWGCTALAALYQKGLGVPQDDGRAQALYEQGCLLDDGAACQVRPQPAR